MFKRKMFATAVCAAALMWPSRRIHWNDSHFVRVIPVHHSSAPCVSEGPPDQTAGRARPMDQQPSQHDGVAEGVSTVPAVLNIDTGFTIRFQFPNLAE